MSIYDDVGSARTPVRIRVVLLADVLEQASDTSSLRSAVLDEALKGKYQLYWPVPADQMAFSGPEESLDPQSPKSIKFPGQPDPEARTARETLNKCGPARYN
jgi:hypothetical protein